MSEPRATTYWDYIRVEDLLALQGGRDRDESRLSNEEVLFITVHQVFELWFKLLLRDLRTTRDLFTRETVAEQALSGAARRLARMTVIFRSATQHFEVVETLGTREYLEFRDALMPASGFQSAQLRQIEILFGLEESERIPFGGEQGHLAALHAPGGGSSPALRRVETELADHPTLREAVERWLLRTPIDGVPADRADAPQGVERFVEHFLAAHGAEVDASCARAVALAPDEAQARSLRERYAREKAATVEFLAANGDPRKRRVRAAMVFIETYRDLPLLAWPREVLAALLALEQGFLVFRQRHARMVERVIGRRTGTGGSAGVEYLDETALRYRVFRDLWAVRTLLVRPGAAPPLDDPEFYGFKSGA